MKRKKIIHNISIIQKKSSIMANSVSFKNNTAYFVDSRNCKLCTITDLGNGFCNVDNPDYTDFTLPIYYLLKEFNARPIYVNSDVSQVRCDFATLVEKISTLLGIETPTAAQKETDFTAVWVMTPHLTAPRMSKKIVMFRHKDIPQKRFKVARALPKNYCKARAAAKCHLVDMTEEEEHRIINEYLNQMRKNHELIAQYFIY